MTLLYGRADLCKILKLLMSCCIRIILMISINEQLWERGRWHKKFGPRAKVLVPPKRQLGGRGVDGTRNLALGPNFLCRPRGRREGEGQRAQEVWP